MTQASSNWSHCLDFAIRVSERLLCSESLYGSHSRIRGGKVVCVCVCCSCSVMPDSLRVIILKNGCKHANRKESIFILITYVRHFYSLLQVHSASSLLWLRLGGPAMGGTNTTSHRHKPGVPCLMSALPTAHHQPWDFPAGAETRVSVYTHSEPVNVQTRNTMRLRPCKTNCHQIRYRRPWLVCFALFSLSLP